MRTLSEINARLPIVSSARSFGRRPLDAAAPQMTALVLTRHQETSAMVFVSDDDDAVGAVWIQKSMVTIERKDRGRFLVVTLSCALARQHDLQIRPRNRDRYTSEERELLTDASQTAARTRDRLSGRVWTFSRCNGRDHYA